MSENDDNMQDTRDTQDTQDPMDPLDISAVNTEKIEKALNKRTLITAVISVPVTILLTVSILFYTIYIPLIKEKADNAIIFDENKDTITAVSKLKQVIKYIEDNYLEILTDKQILEAMTSGFTNSLNNPYTYYLSAEEYQQNKESMSSQYVGIGCNVTHTIQGETILIDVIPDSPAWKAGLKAGDMIISVDGINVQLTNDSEEIAAKVRGEEGTTVKIAVYRPSTDKTISLSIIRKTIRSQNVKYRMLDETTGYIMIKAFVNDVDSDFISAMDSLQAKGAKNIVFDCRYNPGGDAQTMRNMLDYLLPVNTLLASIKGRENGNPFEIKWMTQNGMKVPVSMRYAILVNEYSASASEFFSGCLRDYGKATLIGRNTFGKGSGTSQFELPDGSAVNITMFKYYLPQGESIEGKGLKPDIEIDLAEKDKYTSLELLTPEQDTPLKKAIEILHKTNP